MVTVEERGKADRRVLQLTVKKLEALHQKPSKQLPLNERASCMPGTLPETPRARLQVHTTVLGIRGRGWGLEELACLSQVAELGDEEQRFEPL